MIRVGSLLHPPSVSFLSSFLPFLHHAFPSHFSRPSFALPSLPSPFLTLPSPFHRSSLALPTRFPHHSLTLPHPSIALPSPCTHPSLTLPSPFHRPSLALPHSSIALPLFTLRRLLRSRNLFYVPRVLLLPVRPRKKRARHFSVHAYSWKHLARHRGPF
jgi:hypothetical protein